MTETINWNWTRYSTGTDYEDDDAEPVSVEPPTYDYNILEFTPSTPEVGPRPGEAPRDLCDDTFKTKRRQDLRRFYEHHDYLSTEI